MTSEATLLLGATGFLGANLLPMLEASGMTVVAPTRDQLVAFGDGKVINGIAKLTLELRPKNVINCIAETDWRTCEEHPAQAEVPNIRIPEAAALGLPKDSHFIQISTDAVFGGGVAPYTLANEKCPVSEYGLQKAAAEDRLLNIARGRVSILRGAFFGLPIRGRNNILRHLIEAFRLGKSVEGYSNFVNNPVSVHTFARMVALVLEIGPIGIGHFGAERGYSKWEFASLVAEALGVPEQLIVRVPAPKSSVAHGGLDLTLDSESSWSRIGLEPPQMLAEVTDMRDEMRRWVSFGN